MSSSVEQLYDLTPKEFERLCADVLKAQHLERVELVGGPDDQGVDIICESEGRTVAVQVKHSKRLPPSVIRDNVERMRASSYEPQEYIFITSAPLGPSHRSVIQKLSEGMNLRLIGPDDILRTLDQHPELKTSSFLSAINRATRQRWELLLGFLAMAASIVGVIGSTFSFFVGPEKPELQERIESVERSITNLKDLEGQLNDIKEDMVETEKAKKAIEAEYAKAKELEKLTEEQFDAVKTALRSQSWQKTLFDYVLGFVLGVAASLTASVIYARIRQRRALAAE